MISDSGEKWTDEGSQIVSSVKNCSSLEGITSTEADLEETLNSKILSFVTFTGMFSAEVEMIDGTTRTVTVGVLDANIDNIDSESNTATVTFTLTNLDQSNIGSNYFGFRYFMSMAAGMGIPDLSIPYGLYTYTTTVTLTA